MIEIILSPVSNSGTVILIGYFGNSQKDKIIYSTFDYQSPLDDGEIFIMNPDGTEKFQSTNNPGADYHAQISPNGSETKVVSPFKIGPHQRVQFTRNMRYIFFDSYEYPNQIVRCDFPSFINLKYITTGDDIGGFSLSTSNDQIIYSQGSHQNGYYLFIKDLSTN